MKWAAALSSASAQKAKEDVIDALKAELSDVDLVLIFASPKLFEADGAQALHQQMQAAFPKAVLVGCTGGGVIGDGQEVEQQAALSLIGATLPDVKIGATHLDTLPDPSALPGALGVQPEEDPQFILLADPFSCDVQRLINGLDLSYPGAPKIGGLASGGRGPGQNTLFSKTPHTKGAVVLSLSGAIKLETIIAQGCKPIGHPMLITRCEGNVLHELGSKKTLDTLRALYEELPAEDRVLMQNSLFLGIEMKDQLEYQQGDFLIRNIIGQDRRTDGLVIGARLEQWKAVQFHLRDKLTSAEDLERMLERYTSHSKESESSEVSDATGALLFSCLGRGKHLYGTPDHDAQMFERFLPGVPMAGFFCNGEIGPVGGETFVHGYTSAFGVFRAV